MKKYIYLIFLIVIISSCNSYDDLKNLKAPSYNGEFAIPLVDSRKNLKDLLDDYDKFASLEIDNKSNMILHYKGNIIAKNSLQIFDFASNLLFPVLDTSFAIPIKQAGGVFLDSIKIKSGEMLLALMNNQTFPISLKITLPQFKKNGVVTVRDYMLNVGESKQAIIDLTAMDIVPIKDSIYIKYDARNIANNQRVILSGFLMATKDAKISYGRGYLGKDKFENNADTISIDFFKNWKQGKVTFSDPKIIVRLENSFGIPVRSVVNKMDIEGVDGNVNSLTGQSVTNGVNVEYPKLNEVGKVKNTIFTLDKNNSNIDKIINSNPVKVIYDIDGLINPDLAQLVGFFTDSSYFKLEVEVLLPIEGTATGFEVKDTFDLNWGDASSNIDSAEFKIVTENEMPIETSIQVYFADVNKIVVDSLFDTSKLLLKSAPIDANGLSAGKTTVINYAKMTGAKLQKLRNIGKNLIIKTAFSTTDSGAKNVKVLANQNVNIRIGLRFATKI
jgi:hypothetical protein